MLGRISITRRIVFARKSWGEGGLIIFREINEWLWGVVWFFFFFFSFREAR